LIVARFVTAILFFGTVLSQTLEGANLADVHDLRYWDSDETEAGTLRLDLANLVSDQAFAESQSTCSRTQRASKICLSYDGERGECFHRPWANRHAADFDLRADSHQVPATISFGAAVFNLDLPFLAFDEGTGTFTSSADYSLDERIPTLEEENATMDTVYDMSGRPLDEFGVVESNLFAPQMLTSVILGYEWDLAAPGPEMAHGGIPPIDSLPDTELDLIGVLCMFALTAAALFITFEISRDPFDKYH